MEEYDVLVIGAGPAGLSLAAALARCARGGQRVALVSPTWPVPWPNKFGLWRDEIEGDEELVACCSHTFEHPTVHIGARTLPLDRTYLRLDNEAVRDLFTSRFEGSGGARVCARVLEVRHEARWSVVSLSDAQGERRIVKCGLVVDTTGNDPLFVRRQAPHEPGFQVAYGVRARVERAPEGWLDAMRVMDFRAAGANTAREHKNPSFLYAMPLGEEEVFVEETSLVARPGLDYEELSLRLSARMSHEGVKLGEPVEEEFCTIPMGSALPDFTQRTLAWGGAASGVHPASGYQIARTFARGEGVARALMELVSDATLDGASRAARGWSHIWPARDVKRRELYMYGLELLMEMELDDMERFFTAFFELPAPLWKGYLSDTLEHAEVLTSMWHMFAAIKGRNRLDLMRPVWRSRRMRARLVEGVLGGALAAWK